MLLTATELQTLGLTLQVAGLTTAILLVIGTPLAWWLAQVVFLDHPARSRSRSLAPGAAAPRCWGFYLLVALGPHGPVGPVDAKPWA